MLLVLLVDVVLVWLVLFITPPVLFKVIAEELAPTWAPIEEILDFIVQVKFDAGLAVVVVLIYVVFLEARILE